MRLSRLWDNQSLGIEPREAGRPEAMAAFERRGRRHATRLSAQIAVVGIALICGLWAVIIYAARLETESALDRARAQGQNLSAAFATESTRILDAIVSAMDTIAVLIRDDPGLRTGQLDAVRLTAEIEAIVRPTVRAAVLDAKGRVIYSSLPAGADLTDFSQRPEFRVHRDPGSPSLSIGKPILDVPAHPMGLPVTRRIEGADGSFLGVLLFSLTPGHLTRLHQSVDLGRRGTLAMICRDGMVRARFTADWPDGSFGVGTSVRDDLFPTNLPPGAVTSYIRVSQIDDVARLFTLRRMAEYDMLVSVGTDLDDILADSRRLKLLTMFVGGAVSLLIGFLTLLLVREIWRRTMREIELAREHGLLEEAHAQILHDRERLAATNRELITTAERADAANHAKSQFLASMSHELRTPLHAILGFSELIREQAPRTAGRSPIADYASDILASGRHLLELINTVLDLSKVESGTALLTESIVSMADVVNASMISIRSQAEVRRIAVEIVMPDVPPMVEVDLTKMRQVLINLLSNAVKFTPEGGRVTVTVASDAKLGVVVSVADTGIGMTEAEMVVAMEPFGQVDSTLSRQADGTGLGLPLAQRLVELHGGRLSMQSAKGVGTTVTITLPPDRVRSARPANQTLGADVTLRG